MRTITKSTALFIVLAVAATVAQATGTFDVVSVKAMGPASGEALARFGSGCDGSFPRVENRRFTVTTTAYALVAWAYGFNRNGGCGFVTNGNFITGGPAWFRSERFEIQALMPDTAPAAAVGAFLNGEAPTLEAMLRAMLADRFKLDAHREMRESPVYALVTARGGARLTAAKPDDPTFYRLNRQRDASGEFVEHLVVSNANMTYVGVMLGMTTRRPARDPTAMTA